MEEVRPTKEERSAKLAEFREELNKRLSSGVYLPKNRIYYNIKTVLDGVYTENTLDDIQSEIARYENEQPDSEDLKVYNMLREMILAEIDEHYKQPTAAIHRIIGNISSKKYTHDSRKRNKSILEKTIQNPSSTLQIKKNFTLLNKILNYTPIYTQPTINREDIRDCISLFDPCTREPIENGDITILENRVKEIKKQRNIVLSSDTIFPPDIITRFDLLLFLLNRSEKPNDGLLQYNNKGVLYESYWDIVFTLGLMKEFPITTDFHMYNGKIEELTSIDDPIFINNPLKYLSSRKVSEGNSSGASDITFVYKKNTAEMRDDECSADPSIQITQSCSKFADKKISTPTSPQFFFCSSKFFKNDAKKGIDKFDIQNIYTAAKKFNNEYERKIVLLVKDRGAVEEKVRKALRKYISDEASYVFGMSDLFAALTSLYDYVKARHTSTVQITPEILISIMNLEHQPKPILKLHLHQHLATYKICDAIKNFTETKTGSNRFLVGIVPRGGKTYIAGGIIELLKPQRVVVLLGAKSETLSQFKKDVFETFQNFQEYECVDVVNTTEKEIDPTRKYIFIMSVELYKTEVSSRKLLQELKGGALRADLFICDEAHLKQTTTRMEAAVKQGTSIQKTHKKETEEDESASDEQENAQLLELQSQIGSDVPVVYMTGTYIKPLKAFNIPNENVVIWDYQDIQQAKTLSANEDYFRDIFGELYERSLATCLGYGQTYESIEKQYRRFPELYLLTTQFTPDAKAAFLKQSSGGFPTITHLFEIRKDFNPTTTPPEQWYTGFTNPAGVRRLINYLSPPTQQMEGNITSVLKSVDNIAQRIGDRLGFFTSEFVTHSQLWFLPHMQGHPLYKRMCALVGIIFQTPWFRKYFHVYAVSSSASGKFKEIPGKDKNSIQIKASDGTDSCGLFSWYEAPCSIPHSGEASLKQCLLNEEAKARAKGKGLIILAQNMLHLGISLPCVDIVVLLDSGEKVDERIQKMYRALTESTNKKGGYIIDMNYFRTVTAIINYQITVEESRKGKKKYSDDIPDMFNKVLDIYSVDDDKPILRADIATSTIPELQKMLSLNKKGSDSMLLDDVGKALNMNIERVLKNEYKRSYDEFLGTLREEETRQLTLREEGTNMSRAEHNTEDRREPTYPDPKILKEGATEKDKKEAYMDMYKTTLKLGAFGTDSIDVRGLVTRLGSDIDLRNILYETLIKRGAIQHDSERAELQRDYIIDIVIRPGLNKIVEEGRNASYLRMKETIEDDDKYPKHVESVLKYISDHLTPKDTERHKFGEVFTPMSLVNEMLDTLPAEVWNNPNLKWLDPANGMGNFPIGVFLRLFYGFRTKGGKYIGITNEGEGDYNPGLTKVKPNEVIRRKHIVQNMLFMVELNSKNNAIAKLLFKKLAPGVEPNIIQMHRKDGFLAEVDMEFPNGTVNQFDIVMGNPPYNSGSVKSVTTKKTIKLRIENNRGQEKHTNIWIPILKKIIESHLKKNGYLLFIHPIGWFKPDERTKTHDLILSNQILYMKIYKNDAGAQGLFEGKGKISIAYYLLEKTKPTKKTKIISTDGNIEYALLNTDSLLSLNNNSIIAKIQASGIKMFKDSDNYLTNSITQKICSPGTHKQIHRIYEPVRGVGVSSEHKITFVKTSNIHPYQTVPKIILHGYKYPRFYFDKKGEYGLIGSHQHYFIGDNLDKIEDYFKTKLSALLLQSMKYDMDYIEPKYYPDVRTLPLETINDETLAEYFGFTKEEREAINATTYPKNEYTFKEVTCAELKGEQNGGFNSKYGRTRKANK